MDKEIGVGWKLSQDNSNQVELMDGGENSVRVDLFGGKIVELILGGKKILSEFNRIDGGRGETHPCSPNFGPVDNKYGLGQHGPARKSLWTRLEDDNQDKLTMKHEIDPNAFPQFSGLVIEQSLYLKNGEFVIETTHTNNGGSEIPVNFGEHFYFNALFCGWARLTINGVKMA